MTLLLAPSVTPATFGGAPDLRVLLATPRAQRQQGARMDLSLSVLSALLFVWELDALQLNIVLLPLDFVQNVWITVMLVPTELLVVRFQLDFILMEESPLCYHVWTTVPHVKVLPCVMLLHATLDSGLKNFQQDHLL